MSDTPNPEAASPRTRPDVPHRFELSVEVPGTADQVWDAIATARGITAWMMPTEMEEREGGRVVFHMGDDASSEGTVTGWDPPRRIEYQEPQWAELADQDASTVTPLVTEFLVEARSGGTCIVKVVSSAFGTGADWENEFFESMAKGWTPMFEHLRLYLAHFAGQEASTFELYAETTRTPAGVIELVRRVLGADAQGQTLALLGTKGEVEDLGQEHLLLRLDGPVPGLLAFHAFDAGPDTVNLRAAGYLFPKGAGGDAPGLWQSVRSWVDTLDLKPT